MFIYFIYFVIVVNKTNFTKPGSPAKSTFQKPTSSSSHQFDVLSNINTICTHFSLKIESWKLTNRVKSITPEQVGKKVLKLRIYL